MELRNLFLKSSEYSFEDNVFYTSNIQRPSSFESLYINLRQKENRVYPDKMVKLLPEVPLNHPLRREWQLRKSTSQNLIAYLARKDDNPKILELGCGNGWLCNHLASLPGSEVLGMDINGIELAQASRVFSERKNLCFVYADILSSSIPDIRPQHIILSASVQYFRDIGNLLNRLLALLADGGEIHIVDSPVYSEDNVSHARKRSEEYFSNLGFPMMKHCYHHHTWKMFKPFHPKIQYDPTTFFNKMKQEFSFASPFPWIIITR